VVLAAVACLLSTALYYFVAVAFPEEILITHHTRYLRHEKAPNQFLASWQRVGKINFALMFFDFFGI
jgi:hypothetical protein